MEEVQTPEKQHVSQMEGSRAGKLIKSLLQSIKCEPRAAGAGLRGRKKLLKPLLLGNLVCYLEYLDLPLAEFNKRSLVPCNKAAEPGLSAKERRWRRAVISVAGGLRQKVFWGGVLLLFCMSFQLEGSSVNQRKINRKLQIS